MTEPAANRLGAAAQYATALHANQRRKGSEIPYVAHLFAVAAIVLEAGGTEDQVIAALLHDAIEDHPGEGETAREIESRWGDEVLRLVVACSDGSPGGPRTAENWRERKERYLAAIPHESADALLVSAADKLHNARAMVRDYGELGEELWTRFRAGKEETLWYYRELTRAFARANVGRLADELARTVDELERLAYASPD